MTFTLESLTDLTVETEDAWSIATHGNYLYVGCWYGLAIYDVSDKTAPAYIKNILGGGSTYFVAIRIYNGYLYGGVNDYSRSPNFCGVYVYDLTDPVNPTKVSEEGGENGGADNHLDYPNGIYREGNKLYVTSGWGPALTIIDITDPTNISELGYTLDVKFYGKWSDWWLLCVKDNIVYLILIDYWDGKYTGIIILDCTNPAGIVRRGELSGWDDARMIGTRMGIFTPNSNDYIFISSNAGLMTLDITDLDNPAISSVFTITYPLYEDNWIFCVNGTDAYTSGHVDNPSYYDDDMLLTKLDVTDPLNIIQGDTVVSPHSYDDGGGMEEIIFDDGFIYQVGFAYPWLWLYSDIAPAPPAAFNKATRLIERHLGG